MPATNIEVDILDPMRKRRFAEALAAGDKALKTPGLAAKSKGPLLLKMGEAARTLGLHARAEKHYLDAARQKFVEPKGLWVGLARNVMEQALSRSRQGDAAGAKKSLNRILSVAAGESLYDADLFPGVKALVKTILSGSASAVSVPDRPVAELILDAAETQLSLAAAQAALQAAIPGGFFTFDYLQQAARAFAQEAMRAERDFINFRIQAEAESAMRLQLEGARGAAEAERDACRSQRDSARFQAESAAKAVDAAVLRVDNAREDRNLYRENGRWEYRMAMRAAVHSAREGYHWSTVEPIIRALEEGRSYSGTYGDMAGACYYVAGKKSYEYQLARMDNEIENLAAAKDVIAKERQAADARSAAAEAALAASECRLSTVNDALNAFDGETFTPEKWNDMADFMRRMSVRYRDRAVRAAHDMERAYNFETDGSLSVIKEDYSADGGGVLASEQLLSDIDLFTLRAITDRQDKDVRLKDVISLAREYPLDFQRFLETGRMTFETSLSEFDRRHPGFYGQRLRAVEVEVAGLLPPEGVSGTLRNHHVSLARARDGSDKVRLHRPDTLALSEYVERNDVFLFRADPRLQGLFEGHGVAGTWFLDLPGRSNNLDRRFIADVRLALYYTASFSPQIKDRVLARPPLPGENVHGRDFQLRYDFPDAWYAFLGSGEARFTVERAQLPANETNFRLEGLAVKVIASPGVSAQGLALSLSLPGKRPVQSVLNARGEVEAGGAAWAAALGGGIAGAWSLRLEAPLRHPLRGEDGRLKGELLEQIVIVTEYAFAWL